MSKNEDWEKHYFHITLWTHVSHTYSDFYRNIYWQGRKRHKIFISQIKHKETSIEDKKKLTKKTQKFNSTLHRRVFEHLHIIFLSFYPPSPSSYFFICHIEWAFSVHSFIHCVETRKSFYALIIIFKSFIEKQFFYYFFHHNFFLWAPSKRSTYLFEKRKIFISISTTIIYSLTMRRK